MRPYIIYPKHRLSAYVRLLCLGGDAEIVNNGTSLHVWGTMEAMRYVEQHKGPVMSAIQDVNWFMRFQYEPEEVH